MAVYSLPNLRLYRPRSMSWQLMGNIGFNRAPTVGVITTSELPGDAWSVKLEYGVHYTEERHRLAAFYHRFRGPAHIFRCFDIVKPEPKGTMRGAPTVLYVVQQGAYAMTIQTTAGATLKAGDMLGVASSLFPYPILIQAAEDTAANGAGIMLLEMVAPMRYPISVGAAITWQRPYADFLILTPPVIPFEPKLSPPFSVEAVEFLR